MKSPVFIFSLPRSGSTLLQRVLMSHSQVSSRSEPWFLLPLCKALSADGTLTLYGHGICSEASQEFVSGLPGKQDFYYQELGKFAHNIYRAQCNESSLYFVDKTPRYYEIIPEILKMFPDAKFIFLFRNPVHIFSSIIQTWGKGRLNKLYATRRDIYTGPKALSEGLVLLEARAISIKYEDLVAHPSDVIKKICKYLNLNFENRMLADFSLQDTKGHYGDPTGTGEYDQISTDSIEKWKVSISTKVRKNHLQKYINSMEESCLAKMGYNKQQILREIDELKVDKIGFGDLWDLSKSFLVRHFKPNIWLGRKTKKWAANNFIS